MAGSYRAPDTLLPVLLIGVCLMSAVLFAVGNSLQHHGANNLGGHDLPPLQIAARLARNRVWLAGSVVAMSAFATHLWALSLGKVGLVQPLLLMGVVFGICFRPLLDRRLPHPGDIVGALIAVGGLAIYIRAGDIEDQVAVSPPVEAGLVAAVVIGAVTVVLLSAKRLGLNPSLTFGICAGVLMGTGAGLFNDLFSHGDLSDQLTGWKLPVAIGLEIVGTFLNQRAYHSGPIAISMPALNIASVLVGGLFGALVFGEMPAHDVLAVVLQVGGVLLAAGGLVALALRQQQPEVIPGVDEASSRVLASERP